MLIDAPISVSGPEKFDFQPQNSSKKLISVLSVSVFQLDLESPERRSSSDYTKVAPFFEEQRLTYLTSFPCGPEALEGSVLQIPLLSLSLVVRNPSSCCQDSHCFLILWFLYEKVTESSPLTSLKTSSCPFSLGLSSDYTGLQPVSCREMGHASYKVRKKCQQSTHSPFSILPCRNCT